MPLLRLFLAWLAMAPCVAAAQVVPASQGEIAVSELKRPNVVVVLRHASAPGVGDPPGFKLDDCSTQRNLDANGRQQAARLGSSWKAAGFRPTRVYSSAWCRCQDTARLIDLGPVRVQPLLNSFFGADAQRREAQTAQLSRFIDGLDPRGGPYLLVTHQVVITALSGHGADSGGGVAIELQPGGAPRRARVLPNAGLD
ncbi:Phosphoglycerate mutase family protein [Cupriavidus necator]|uniref:Histidine phosphatase family protein n=1 Tax=Cupriavidus necator (strain ATCC 17699 / DSM 428 / KCTC 22496 / NCIMB 10442 / H16 / Stanier 337) TaxID=381666 RepID=Q0KEM2_CUPNH|nr:MULTISPECIES: histidine phosphatase family protein [Cupriavidus]EON16408.1 phosphoglycerate mutase family protein [Cupriavidus sp. GA3-3]KUE87283.1 phosphoglycerate mutase [Cupriavidus necator]QCB99495.1 histidine phosphatase family protein [Cupriavidus necator H16]QQB77688.1 histidine phosphatase family protein [Cupriavidus necator]WKA41327.1 histidine phosphatase family protein [Cupriavidus necator]